MSTVNVIGYLVLLVIGHGSLAVANNNQNDLVKLEQSNENTISRFKSDRPGYQVDQNYRLKNDIVPLHYNLTFDIDPANDYVDGKIYIKFRVNYDTKVFRLHVKWNLVHVSKFQVVDFTEAINYLRRDPDHKWETAFVEISSSDQRKFEANQEYTAYMEFRTDTVKGSSNDVRVRTPYETLGLVKLAPSEESQYHTYYMATQNYGARRVYPCFDEPRFKADFTLTINLHGNLTNVDVVVKSNSKRKPPNPAKPNQWVFTNTKPFKMSTYLFAFALGNFKGVCDSEYTPSTQCDAHISSNQEDLVCTYVRPHIYTNDSLLELVHRLNHLATDMWCKMKDLTGIESGVQLQFVFLPELVVGGREDWGVVLIDEIVFAYQSFAPQIYRHEVVHYWIGNLATVPDWKYYWVQESLTYYLQFYSERFSSLSVTNRSIVSQAKHRFTQFAEPKDKKDVVGPSCGMDQPYWAKGDFAKEFSEKEHVFIQHKGSLVMYMLRCVLQEHFYRGIFELITHSQQGQMDTAKFMESFQKVIDQNNIPSGWQSPGKLNVTDFLFPFIRLVGYPTLKSYRKRNTDKYKFVKEDPPHRTDLKFHLPVFYIKKNTQERKMIWVNENPVIIDDMEDINEECIGYYKQDPLETVDKL